MDPVQAVVLALVQGFTEFLPISSSGHLILMPAFFGWTDQGLGFDIAVHLGTLIAVVAYFRRDIVAMSGAMLRREGAEARLAWQIIAATVPLGIAGLVFADLVETTLRAPIVIAASSAGFGALLWAADFWRRGPGSERELGWSHALAIGFAQALALIPGTSRSGITMTMALALGMSREAAGRFSFLLAIPAIGMAGAWQALQFARAPDPVDWTVLAVAAGISAVTAFVAIAVFLRLIGKIGMAAFAIYRIVLAGVILYVLV